MVTILLGITNLNSGRKDSHSMALKEEQRQADGNIFEGIISFRAIVLSDNKGFNDRKIKTVYYSAEKLQKNSHEFSYIKAKSHELGFNIEICPKEKIDSITVGTSHGGIAIECEDRTIPRISPDLIPEKGFFVLLDGIEDPYNFGYALRSMYAAGVDGVILNKRNWMNAAGIVCRSSAGASECLPMYIYDDPSDLLEFKSANYSIVCTDIDNSVSLYETSVPYPLLLVVGGEKRGISKKILEMADLIVRLDYARPFPAALSAASAASIICFEISRQRGTYQS